MSKPLYRFQFNKKPRPCATIGCDTKFVPAAPNGKYCKKCRAANPRTTIVRRVGL